MNANTYTLGAIEVADRVTNSSQRRTARVAGLLYLVIIIAGIFAEFFVRASLIVPGDATATAENIKASESLFRSGIAADLIMIASDIALALAFYALLRPVSYTLALLAAFFRLAQAAVLGVNLLTLFFGLQLLSGAGYLTAVGAEQVHAQAMLFFNAHGIGYSIGLVFFGFNCLVLGYLIFRSGFLPAVLGALLVFAGLGYLTDSFAQVLLPNYADYEAVLGLVVFLPAILGELALCLWLLVKGVKI